MNKHDRASQEGQDGQQNLGHCWVHEQGAWALGRGMREQVDKQSTDSNVAGGPMEHGAHRMSGRQHCH